MRLLAGTAAVAALLLPLATPAPAPHRAGRAGLQRRRVRTWLRRRALAVKLRVGGTDTAAVKLTARLRGRRLATAVVNIAAGSTQTAVIPLGFAERRRLRRARHPRIVVDAVATDASGRQAKARR